MLLVGVATADIWFFRFVFSTNPHIWFGIMPDAFSLTQPSPFIPIKKKKTIVIIISFYN